MEGREGRGGTSPFPECGGLFLSQHKGTDLAHSGVHFIHPYMGRGTEGFLCILHVGLAPPVATAGNRQGVC